MCKPEVNIRCLPLLLSTFENFILCVQVFLLHLSVHGSCLLPAQTAATVRSHHVSAGNQAVVRTASAQVLSHCPRHSASS